MKLTRSNKRPGKYGELNKEARSTLDVPISDGFKMEVSKTVSPYFQISHSMGFGSQQAPSSYMFHSTFAKENYMISGAVDPSGNVMGQGRVAVGKIGAISGSATVQRKQNVMQYNSEAEVYGRDCVAYLKADSMPHFSAGYTQSITDNVAVGGEVVHVLPRRMTVGAFGARVEGKVAPAIPEPAAPAGPSKVPAPALSHVGSLHYNSVGSIQGTYFRQLNSLISAAADVSVTLPSSPAGRGVTASVGYQGRFRRGLVKASASTDGTVTSMVSHALSEDGSARLTMTAGLNYKQDGYIVGMGLSFGQ